MSRSVTAWLMGDPHPERLARAEALRLSLPEPREIDLGEWLEPDGKGAQRPRQADPLISYERVKIGEAAP